MPNDYDYVFGFFFSLSFEGEDVPFQEVSGISKELSVEEVVCGGENRFKYRLPTVSTSQNLVLKRAIAPTGSKLIDWCSKVIDEGMTNKIVPQNILLRLLKSKDEALITWTFHNAYPIKYAVSDLKSEENGIVIESIELAYSYFNVSRKP
ncbi:MAG: phage tail protein [Chitinophagaceae bacterium]